MSLSLEQREKIARGLRCYHIRRRIAGKRGSGSRKRRTPEWIELDRQGLLRWHAQRRAAGKPHWHTAAVAAMWQPPDELADDFERWKKKWGRTEATRLCQDHLKSRS